MTASSAKDLYQKLIESSFHFISFRPRSEKEVRDFLLKKLQKWKISDESIVERVTVRLRELGYLDDAKFVTWWADQRQSHKPKGARLIRQELLAKGIHRDVIDEQLKPSTEEELARRAARKKLALWQKLPVLERERKIYGFLSRRGFDSETIRHTIRGLDVESNSTGTFDCAV